MSTYSWSGPNGFSSALQSPSVSASATAAMAGLYTLTVTNGSGCQNTATTTVTVNALPTPAASNNGPVCAGQTLSLGGLPNGMSTYSWSGPNGFSSALQSPSVSASATAAMAGLYTLTVTTASGCQNTATTTVTVNALPTPAASNNGPVCAGQALSLGGLPNGMSTYSWSGPNGFSSALQNPSVSASATAAMAGVYTLTVTNASGCQNTATTTVTVNALPTPTASNNGPVCVGQALSVSGLPNGMTSYSWSGPNGFSSALQNPSVSASATAAMAGVYTLTVTNASGCQNTATTTVTVNALPTPTASNNGPVCVGQALSVSGLPNGMTSYSWSGPNGFSSALQSPSVSASATAAMAGVYTLTVTNASGCQNTATTTITVNALPIVTSGSNSPICTGNSLNLTALPNGMVSYSWSGPNGFTSLLQNPSISNAQTLDAGIYTVTVNDGNCNATSNVIILINITPVSGVIYRVPNQ
jgi:hypothetical protein